MRPLSTIFASALAFAFVLVAGNATANDLNIKAFAGQWQGNGVSESEVSANFRLTARDLNVAIEMNDNGFVVTTTTVQRKKGDPSNPDAVRKTSKREFVAGVKPGVWVSKDNTDPSGQAFTWARIKDQTLTITSVEVDKDGGSNMLIYDRTLGSSGMKLEFRRLVDGYIVRTVSGRLIKLRK
ncbi:MAG: hypothetical protein HN725_18495 [Alphaproteobacteria bacterium]|jgi:hypothetical protein|nr:hypothetical protein [Alphaproteobacteria bacterium]MBT4082949.1 hypothetical protein [Alphaproteobacteria bacterium]MBT4544845.1 hypothetical protein [Alphaproteobacteria bacterium]MBT5917854.1 hypothetical protein [Alphaproteobacteria bacterium]MBT6384686.1 hypothetical protein [Alphaproteobacteria bacterium]